MSAFSTLSNRITDAVGHPVTFLLATAVCLAWPIFDRPFDWLDAMSDLTVWLLFALQASQNADTNEMKAELRELVRAVPEADDQVIEETYG